MKNNDDIAGQRKILFFDTECVLNNNNGNLMILKDKSKNDPPKPKYFKQISWMVYSENEELLYYKDGNRSAPPHYLPFLNLTSNH